MTMQQVTGPFADRSPQGAAPRAGQAGFAETTVFDCATRERPAALTAAG